MNSPSKMWPVPVFVNSRAARFMLLLVWLLPGLAHAATYNVPPMTGTPFSICTLSSGTTYTCSGTINIGNNHTINVASSMTLNVSGSFNMGTGDNIVVASGNTLNVVANGTINIGNNTTSSVNFTSTAGTINVGTNGVVSGNLSAPSGTVNVGNNAVINGNVSGGTVTTGSNSTINGTINGTCSSACTGRNLTIGNATVAEGNSGTKNATFTVTLSSSHTSNVTFNYATSSSTATGGASCTAGVDYVTASGGGTITAGSTTTTITVQVCGDTTKEVNEIFKVILSSPVNAVLGSPSYGTGTIDNDDALADYHFDECNYNGTSGEVVDTRGSYPATSKGAFPTTQASGVAGGRSLNLNALNKYVTPNAKILLPGDYTLSFWMYKPLPAPGANPIYASSSLAKHTNNNCYGDFLNIRSDASYVWRVYRRSTGGANGTYSISSLSTGWHHFAVTATGGTSTLYVDGVNRGIVARQANGDRVDLGLGFIGASCDDPNGQALRTPIDEFMVFDSVLSASTISGIYTNQLAGNNYDGTARTAASCGGLDHIRVEHDGAANTCSSETLTVKACGNAACSTLYTAAAVTGNVTWSGTPGGTVPFTIPISTGQTTVSLSVPSAQTVTLGSASVSPAPTNSGDCYNTAAGTGSCSLVYSSSGSCFDAVEVGAAASTPILTKLAGTNFSLDVRTTSGAAFTGTVEVSLVDPAAGSGNCADLNAGLTVVTNASFSAVNKKTVTFNYAQAAKNVKVRMRDAATSTPGCSSDNFAIRPQSFTVSNTTAMNPASNTLKAGGTNFILAADPGVTAGYLGSVPTLDTSNVTDHTGAVIDPGWLTGSFTAGSGGSVSGSAFKYNEVGTFTLGSDAVVDSTFTAVDQVTGVVSGVDHGAGGDCTSGSTGNSASPYGCNIGSASLGPLGRFTPDRYQTVVTQGCDAGGFSYSRQPFTVQVTAYNSAGGITTRLDNATGSAYTKPVTLSSTATTGSIVNGTVAANLFAAGVATTGTPAFTFASPLTVAETITVKATDTDAITSTGFAEGTTEIRSGRLRLENAYGSELLPLQVPARAEYYVGNNTWKVNSLDSCTVLPTTAIALGNRNPSGMGSSVSSVAVRSTGVWDILLAQPSAAGTLDLTLDLGAGTTAASDNCLASWSNGPSATTPASLSHLLGQWCGSNPDRAPVTRVKFGSPKAPYIFLRERY